jgi:hypothetical protein
VRRAADAAKSMPDIHFVDSNIGVQVPERYGPFRCILRLGVFYGSTSNAFWVD